MAERRAENRRVRLSTVKIKLLNNANSSAEFTATMEDVSELSMGLRTTKPIEIGSEIEILNGQNKRTGIVARCSRLKFEYEIGVRLSSDTT